MSLLLALVLLALVVTLALLAARTLRAARQRRVAAWWPEFEREFRRYVDEGAVRRGRD